MVTLTIIILFYNFYRDDVEMTINMIANFGLAIIFFLISFIAEPSTGGTPNKQSDRDKRNHKTGQKKRRRRNLKQ